MAEQDAAGQLASLGCQLITMALVLPGSIALNIMIEVFRGWLKLELQFSSCLVLDPV